MRKLIILSLIAMIMIGCDNSTPNNPYPNDNPTANTYYSYFSAQPKTLDPARSYSSDESLFTSQIYEAPLHYHYLKRPYQLQPLTASQMPEVRYFDKHDQPLPKTASPDQIAYSTYTIHIKPDIVYSPHPAFVKDVAGNYRYHQLTSNQLNSIYTLADFPKTATRELTADDYIYQIKRLSNPAVQSPIYGLMSDYIVGLKALHQVLEKSNKLNQLIDLRQYELTGVKKLDRYTYQITIKGDYPQFLYWLAMPFFAPIPWEVDQFYSQPGLIKKNITLDWYPIGTGPYELSENNPNRRMILTKNPNYRKTRYPKLGMEGDVIQGYLTHYDQVLPFIDRIEFNLEKETIPQWNKFLQGYYDQSGISNDSFDQAVQISEKGELLLTPNLMDKEIRMRSHVGLSSFYYGFNMLDPVVGGNSERARLLRQAISIAINQEEFIPIFLNGRAIPAQGPLPPGIFGFKAGKAGYNPYVYHWKNNHAVRKPVSEAKILLEKAGYHNGIDPKTGEPLMINFDAIGSGDPDTKARFMWVRKQFENIGLQLAIRASQYNYFQDKMRTGNAQFFFWGWNADYPDPENFLFLLYGPNGKVKFGGENAANYHNADYDRLFKQMKSMPDSPKRQAIIDKMVDIVRHDAPWVWGYHPKSVALQNSWVSPIKPSDMIRDHLQYIKLDPKKREVLRKQWNKPIIWPLWMLLIILVLVILPVFLYYRHMMYKPLKRYQEQ